MSPPLPIHDNPLAKKITDYILDNQDDAAQEERWRTTMKRETMKRFRELRDTQREMQRENMKRFQALDEKMDQLIKNTKPAQH